MTPRQASYQFPWNLCSWQFRMSVTCWGERSASGAFSWATQRSPDSWVMRFENSSSVNLKIEYKHITSCVPAIVYLVVLGKKQVFLMKYFKHIKVQKIIELTSMYSLSCNILFREWKLQIFTNTIAKVSSYFLSLIYFPEVPLA